MAVPRMELDLVNTIKVELEEEVEAAEESDNNNTRLPEPEQPLALVKPRLERDITERFPYIDEVELQTNVRENFKITEKAQTSAVPSPDITFTFKSLCVNRH